MRRLEITSVMATDDNSEKQIDAISGATPDGSLWLVSHQDAIEGVRRGRWLFCVRDSQGSLREVEIAQQEGRTLLRPRGDELDTSLFALPRCRIASYVFLRADEVVATKY